MPWQPSNLMQLKREFIALANTEGANRRALCRRFGISPKAAYALLARHAAEGDAALQERSRRPKHSPARTPQSIEQAILALRQSHPCWGARKLARRLADLGHSDIPSPSTITAILQRHQCIRAQASEAAQPWQRFEHDAPNALWQIDFKGPFETLAGPCQPLTLLDDHSRFNLALHALQRTDTGHVQEQLQAVFRRYGLPVRMNADNGSPWGSPSGVARHSLSTLGVWLVRQGIRLSHSAPYHPQTNGKLERFHRSLKAEVLNGRSFASLAQAQQAFAHWREVYNHERPHEALQMQTPIQRYQCSPRSYSEVLAPIEYGPEDIVLTVDWNGWVKYRGYRFKVSNALHRLPIALRAGPAVDGCFEVFFCHHSLMTLDMREPMHSN